MITPDHVDAARTRLAEIEQLTGYQSGSSEWFEVIAEEVGVEVLALRELAIESVVGFRSFCVGVLAHQYADRGEVTA